MTQTEEILDLSFLTARPIFTYQAERINLLLVGTGGTGSYLARHVARLAWLLRSQYGKEVSLAFVDPDIVETGNVLRQDFCEREIGLPKAQTLAFRYSGSFGLEIQTIVERFHPDMVQRGYSGWKKPLTVLIGTVDNADARLAISEALTANGDYDVPRTWWLDCGNFTESGQVLLGTTNNQEILHDAFATPGHCRKLPSPVMQHPELLIARPEERPDTALSCEQMLLANVQSLMINQQVAALAADMLCRLLITQKLRRFATYLDQPSGVMSSRYITPETVAQAMRQEVSFFSESPTSSARKDDARDEEDEMDEEDEQEDE